MSGGVLNALPQVSAVRLQMLAWTLWQMHHAVNMWLCVLLRDCACLQVLEIYEVHGETTVRVVTAAAPCMSRQQVARNVFQQ